MGNVFSSTTYYASDEEDKIEDDEFIPASKEQLQARRDQQMTTDAANAAASSSLPSVSLYSSSRCPSDIVLTLEKVVEIEAELDLYEKISLIYLLYDDAHTALQYALQLQNDAPLQILQEWVCSIKNTDNEWRVKLIEALTIIQNYQVLCTILGFDKGVLQQRFLPHNESISLAIDKVKKKLYRIAENFDNTSTVKFLNIVRNDFKTKGIDFYDCGVRYLEMYFLHWTTINYISPDNLKNICSALKIMEKFDVAENLEDLIKTKSERRSSDEGYAISNNTISSNLLRNIYNTRNLRVDLIRQESSTSSVSSAGNLDISLQPERSRKNSHAENNYKINDEKPGICLIINQEHFYKEFDEEYEKLLPDVPLERRDGTNIDRDRLKNTFERFGFKVFVENDLVHDDIIEKIKEVISTVPKDSSFIVCILSHGLEGKIYGVNSIPVKVQDIQNVMCKHNPNLKGQPKILILQSCQGQSCQEVTEEASADENEDLATDGLPAPYTADMLVFWATVPGFGAVRDRKRGSWFIQSLCNQIVEKAKSMHFEDICTVVKQEVINKRWETKNTTRVMVPIKESTFSRFFYLPYK